MNAVTPIQSINDAMVRDGAGESRSKLNTLIMLCVLGIGALFIIGIWSITHQPSQTVTKVNHVADAIIDYAKRRPNDRGGQGVLSEFQNKWLPIINDTSSEIVKNGGNTYALDKLLNQQDLLNSGDIWGDIRKIGEALKASAKTMKP